MILHCWYCSMGGERLSKESEVAVVDTDKLCQPVDASMFRHLPDSRVVPFAPTEWRYMQHKACGRYPWPQIHVAPMSGPNKILTDQGMIVVPQVLPQEKVDAEINEPIPSLTQDDKPWMCLVCEWVGKTEPALKRHITMTGHS